MPRKSVVRLTDCLDMTLAIYHGRKTTTHQQQITTSIFFPTCTKGHNFCDFLFVFLDEQALPKCGQLLKERTCSYRSKFFPLRVDRL